MENKINIAEILKDCPKGMELDCTLFDDVYFDSIDEVCDIIKCYIKDSHHKIGISFNKYGHYSNIRKAKCVIFPKGKTTWEGFVPPCKFKDGDIVISAFGDIHLLSTKDSSYCSYRELWKGFPTFDGTITTCIKVDRLATEEEKQKLFEAIKDNGYKWNAETKTLEKLPMFKVGDRIRHKEKTRWACTIARVKDRYYVDGHPMCFTLPFSEQDDYELVPNKFDITTLKPFDKVLVRDSHRQIWTADFFSHNIKESFGGYRFACVGHCWHQCIPYEGNQHLLGTSDDCDNFYKTWE